MMNMAEQNVKMVCFDFDNVLVDGNFFATTLKLLDSEATDLKVMVALLRSTRDPDYFEVFIRKLAEMLKGFELKKIRELITLLKPMKGMVQTLGALHRRGVKIVVLSTDDERLIQEFLQRNGVASYISEIHGVLMGVKDGRLTGEYSGSLTPQQKLQTFREVMRRHKLSIDEVAYVGDGLTDIPIFERTCRGVVFCPDTFTKIALLTNEKTVDKINKSELYLVHEKDLMNVLEFI